jgi:hypothetical protein
MNHQIDKPKVFCIGFHKTGTTSLHSALEVLGYKVCEEFGVHDPDIRETALPRALALVPEYDAFRDNPWPILYQELDEQVSGSKFILTMRPAERWIRSVLNHFGGRTSAMREWIYGVGDPTGNEQRYIERYQQHNEDVQHYFADRPGDLLVIDLTAGDGWEKLCPFLGCSIPVQEFPHSNKRYYGLMKVVVETYVAVKKRLTASRG